MSKDIYSITFQLKFLLNVRTKDFTYFKIQFSGIHFTWFESCLLYFCVSHQRNFRLNLFCKREIKVNWGREKRWDERVGIPFLCIENTRGKEYGVLCMSVYKGNENFVTQKGYKKAQRHDMRWNSSKCGSCL